MRLRQIQRVLRSALPRLKFGQSQVSGTANFRVEHLRDVLDAVRAIRETGMFQSDTETILTTDVIVQHAEDSFIVTSETFNRINTALHQIRAQGTVLLEALDANLEDELPAVVAVRIPDATDLDTVADALREVKAALQQLLLNDYVEGEVRLESFDRGSNWLEIALGSVTAVSILGAVLRMIMDTRLKEAEIATRWAGVETMKINNEALTSIKEALAAELEEFKADRLNQVAETAGIPRSEHETRERVKFAASLLSDLIARGSEFVPSSKASDEVRDAFPLPAQLTGLIKELPGPRKEIEGDH